MDGILRDFRFGIRALRQSPGFALSAILALALGIGGDTAMFSVAYTVLWRPLPYRSPEQIVRILEINLAQNSAEINVAPANFRDFRAMARGFREMAAAWPTSRSRTGPGGAVRVSALAVSPGFFEVLGARPLLGRAFLPDGSEAGANRAVLLSERGWRGLFGADPSIVGKTIALDGENYTVMGVLPSDAEWPGEVDLWLPLVQNPLEAASRTGRNLAVLGRLRPAVTVAQGEAELQSAAATLAAQHPVTNRGWSVRVLPIRETMVREARPALLLLLAGVTFVLLIACVNVANLCLVRAAGRQREMAIRIAMGAGRGRIIRQLLAESLLLSSAGAAAGLLLAVSCVKAITTARPNLLPRIEGFAIDWSVLGFAVGLAVVTAVLFGLIPAWQFGASGLNAALRDGGRGSSPGKARNTTRSLLVIGEVSLSLVLLVGTGLLVRSLIALYSTETGFKEQNVLTANVSLSENLYQDDRKIADFFREALRRIRALPGVQAAGGVTALPMTRTDLLVRFQVEGAPPVPVSQLTAVRYDTMTPGYLEAMAIPLLRGRVFNERDTLDSPAVALVSESLAKRYFPGQDPVGKRITFNVGTIGPRTIVGVVGDVKHLSLEEGPRAAIYDCSAQLTLPFLWIVVRGDHVASLGPAIRREFAAVDKDQPIGRMRMMEDVIADSLFQRRLAGALIGGFATLAVAMAAVGIYGTIAYSVAQRRTEIGIRLALGARHEEVRWMVVRQGLTLALSGAAAGAALALFLSRLVGSMLYGVRPADPFTYAVSLLLLLAIAWIACYIPAARVTSVDPAVALRNE